MHRALDVRIITLTLAAALVSAAAACTASTAEPTNDSTSKKDAGKSSSSGDDSTDDEAQAEEEKDSGAPSTGSTGQDCSGETTLESCETCCGYNQQIDEIFAQAEETYIQCACTDTCKTACGTFCTDLQAEPSDECTTCLDSDPVANECGPKADEGCNANAECKTFLECEEKSSCLDKMEDSGG